MLQAALGGLILLGIYKFIDSKSEHEIDWWMTASFIFIPAFAIFLLAILFGIFGISQEWLLAGYLLYVIYPYLFLKVGLEFQTMPALRHSLWVIGVVLVTEVAWVLVFGAPDA